MVAAYRPSKLLESPRLAPLLTTCDSVHGLDASWISKISSICTALDRTEAIIGLTMTVMRHLRPDLESSVSRCGEPSPVEKRIGQC